MPVKGTLIYSSIQTYQQYVCFGVMIRGLILLKQGYIFIVMEMN